MKFESFEGIYVTCHKGGPKVRLDVIYVFPNICFAENVVPYQTIATNIKVNIKIYISVSDAVA